MPGDQRAHPSRLADGTLRIVGRFERSSNGTFLALATLGAEANEVVGADPEDDPGTLVVYKPSAAERPLWDFPTGDLCRREVASAELARELGWPLVPPVILRDGPLGMGSVQLFIEHDDSEHALSLLERFPDDLRSIALFDMVVNNADRKAGHCLLGTDGRLYAIDHGLTFHEHPKLRTVLWDFAGEPLPDGSLEDLRRAERVLEPTLAHLLSSPEIRATRERIVAIVNDPVFPEPTGDRPIPWPPL